MRLLIIILSLLCGCTQSTYEVVDPHPTLDVTILQNTYIIDEPIYVQVKASQRGYDGAYRLAVTLNEGTCDFQIREKKLQGNGTWTTMPNASEMLTITPRTTGRLRVMLEVLTDQGQQSRRNAVNLTIAPSNVLTLDITYPPTHSKTKPVEIILKAGKAGYNGAIEVKYNLQAGTGSLQYGAIDVSPGETFSVAANAPHLLHYIAFEQGVHRLQFAAIDNYITEYKTIEFIITK